MRNFKFEILNFNLRRSRRERGVALIVILAFVVLLTAMVLAYFSSVTLQRQISQASFNQTAVEVFTQGAVNTITGDLKQEIVAGSTATNIVTGSVTNTLCFPIGPTNAVPALAGSSGNNGLENLVKRSSSTNAFYPGGITRAATHSTTNPSKNGRYISPARWNAPLLLPKANSNSATDFTPTNTFIPPDWVLVARDGSNPTLWNTNMRWSPANPTTVIGRYSYAIYDEGGLLDVNAAGYPPGSSTNLTAFKENQVYADLAVLPGMTTNAVSALVGWRNYASSQPGGSFPSYTFDSTAQTNYFRSVRANSSGFLRTGTTNSTPTGQTDRQFVSRQQLIQFLTQAADPGSAAALQNALQYLGNYSRTLEQPSFVPNPSRPRIVAPLLPAPPAPDIALTYQGNNDAAGSDDAINPSFLSTRVASAFSRNDGTTASVGEPLVKQRFSLKRLAWLTYKGPSASRGAGSSNTTDPDYDMWALVNTHGISASFLQQGTAANIQNYFGLTWDDASRVWIYNHTSPGGHVIGRLGDLLATREPDFAELLKAAINVGSLGKAAQLTPAQQYQYNLDRSTDYHLLQIMANIIDQSDVDSFPTKIQFSFATTTKSVAGAEDLPYAYRGRLFVVCTRKPDPLLSNSDAVTFKDVPSTTGDGSTADVTVKHAVPMETASGITTAISDPGEATALRIPDVWNPCDPNCATTTSKAVRPTNFRVVLLTYNAGDAALNWQVYAAPGFSPVTFANATSGSYKAPNIPSGPGPSDQSPSTVLSDAGPGNSALEFQDNAGALFREPTLLWRPNLPAGSALKMGAGNALGVAATDANNPNNKSYIGFLIGRSPVSIVGSIAHDTTTPATKSVNGKYIFQGDRLNEKDIATPGVSGATPGYYTFRMQYEYPSGSGRWFTYDEKFAGVEGNGSLLFCANPADFFNNRYLNPFALGALGSPACAYDPRAARFGMGTESEWTTSVPNNGPAFEVQLLNVSAGNNAIVGASDFTVLMTNRAGADKGQADYFQVPGWQTKAAQMRWFSGPGYHNSGNNTSPKFYDGLLSQNNPAITVTAKNGSTAANLYYEDPDGICRRAMGAYVPVGAVNNPATTATGLPMATANAIGAGGVPTATAQSQSRPFILNRPFRSVGELSYTFRGTPWKNIDFFTPESGDAALLDVFCLSDPPQDGLTAGKLNLNTRNAPVLQAVVAGAYIDELRHLTSPPAYALTPTVAGEALSVANKLISMTTDTTAAWRGPLSNVSELVGRYIPNPGAPSGATDQYTFLETISGSNYTYAGFSAALDSTVLTNPAAPLIQRFREAPIRALAACGQTRVWNLMIDVVAQTGRYPQNADTLDHFVVEGEKRYWVHLAIDRLTGKILDKQMEAVTE